MAATPTIPVDPKPGERYAIESPPGSGLWDLFFYDTGDLIVEDLSEADARLLVFGARAVEALRPFAAVETHPAYDDNTQAALSVKDSRHAWLSAGAFRNARTVLNDLEVPK